ncbi:MAG: hypothetical protein AAGB35_02520 [Pseudomonadota bacterium]
MKYLIKPVFISLSLFVLSSAAVSASTIITTTVAGTTNLYNAGYPSLGPDAPTGLPFPEAFNLPGADNPSSVSLMGSAFNFSGFDTLDFTASGFVQDNGIVENESITDADGLLMGTGQPTNFPGPDFQGLPVYSLIGIFSTTEDFITPLAGTVEAAQDVANIGNPALSAFAIGTELTLDISAFSGLPNLYLFLGENDGIFSDNGFIDIEQDIGAYDVTIVATVVPLPAAFWLFASSLLGVVGIAKKRKN